MVRLGMIVILALTAACVRVAVERSARPKRDPELRADSTRMLQQMYDMPVEWPAMASSPAPGVQTPQLPSVMLPPELDRVLRDYEHAWRGRDPAALGGYTGEAGSPDLGKFILALRRQRGGPWLIAADIDNSNQRPRPGPP